MFSKMVLPLLGGSPSVWNTCMVFYQAVLLAGYGLSHGLIRRLGVRRQAVLQLGILALGFWYLPVAIPPDWAEGAAAWPAWQLLKLMFVTLGIPLLAISATAPMLQMWFAQTRHPAARDPYFLYGASNLGSLAALLGYPLALEPLLRLPAQTGLWTTGYALLGGLTFICAVIVWKSPGSQPETRLDPPGEENLPTWIPAALRLRWVMLAFVPSALLLGLTTYMTTDIAAVPLLWVIPLAVYLVTYILAFARRPRPRPAVILALQPYLVLPPVLFYFWGGKIPLLVNLPLHLFAFFMIAMMCHGQLAKSRPAPVHLTEFYLWLSAGGVLGGLFMALVSPLIFKSTIDYPLMIAASCLLRPQEESAELGSRSRVYMTGIIAGLIIMMGGLVSGNPSITYFIGMVGLFAASSLFGSFLFQWISRPAGLGAALMAFIALGAWANDLFMTVLYRNRDFFGPLLVRMNTDERYRLLLHGTTLHGAQSCDPKERQYPLTYYDFTGPAADAFQVLRAQTGPRRIGLVGLGTGSLAAYGQPGDEFTFYEINPQVVYVARDSGFFTFLADSAATVRIVMGDGRIALHSAPAQYYDAIFFDAFSSGSIPVHLLTREALELYRSKLKENGLLVFHISNRTLNLEPVMAGLAQDQGWEAWVGRDHNSGAWERKAMKAPSTWVVMARRPEDLGSLPRMPKWESLAAQKRRRLWTDDYSDIVRVFQIPRFKI
ncbi:MAG: fused MFS/spermidine synthase [bacterium]